MRIVYISGPYSSNLPGGVHQNILHARSFAVEVWKMPGAAALCPHLNSAHFDSVADYEKFIEGDLEMVRRSDAVLMIDGWEHSPGAWRERDEATERCIPVFYSLADLRRWIEGS